MGAKYKPEDRVRFVSSGDMLGRVGKVLFVRKDGNLIVHFDGSPEGTATFVSLLDVAPEQRVVAKRPISRKSPTQLEREIVDSLVGFNRYRYLPHDDAMGNPLHSYGSANAWRLGSYWTIPLDVSLAELSDLRAVVQSRARLRDVEVARKSGLALPPIELGVFRDGSAWIADGNHRLANARRSGVSAISTRFTFVGT